MSWLNNPFLAMSFGAPLALLLLFLIRLYRQRTFFKGLPQPPHSFLWGHLKVMGEAAAMYPPNCHPQIYLTTIAQKYNLKGIFYMDLWPVGDPLVLVTNIDLMDQVHVKRAFPQHKLSDDFMAPIIGRNSIATSNGKTWKMLHNAMAPALAHSHVKNLITIITEEVLTFRERLDKLAKSGEVFSMEQYGAELIFDVIAQIIFHFPLYAQTHGSQYLTDVREMVHLAEAQFSLNPVVKIQAWLKRGAIMRRLHSGIYNQIMDRYRLLKEEGIVPQKKDPYSILDLMLRGHLQELGSDLKAKKAAELSRDYIELLITNIKALLLGGHGTTNDTLCYILMLLSKNPEALGKLRAEHDRVFDPDFQKTLEILRDSPYTVNELEYTTGVIKEALRLFPVGFGVRQAPEGSTLVYDGQTLPIDNNLAVVALPHHLHYNPEIYPDPCKFEPERFMGSDPVPRNAFRTFSRGARACLGQTLAIDELRVILLLVIRDYNFECAGLKPNPKPRASYTTLDTVYGDIVFQELGMEAKPRGAMMMTVSKNRK